MKTLTENQKQFILSFFKDDRYAGWKNIATALIENGKCIVPGEDCIWNRGYIGNFIETKETDKAIDCLEYNFDLDSFLSSAYCKEVLNEKIRIETIITEKLQKELAEQIIKVGHLNELL